MAEEESSGQEEVSIGIANELVDFANNKLDTGILPMVIASALRHAAANFTAFADVWTASAYWPISFKISSRI